MVVVEERAAPCQVPPRCLNVVARQAEGAMLVRTPQMELRLGEAEWSQMALICLCTQTYSSMYTYAPRRDLWWVRSGGVGPRTSRTSSSGCEKWLRRSY